MIAFMLLLLRSAEGDRWFKDYHDYMIKIMVGLSCNVDICWMLTNVLEL